MRKTIVEKILSLTIIIVMVLSYVPPFISRVEASGANIRLGPELITTKYESEDTIVADYVIEPSTYPDEDMSQKINNALLNCYSNGGGTVYLPAGIYKISKPINVLASCNLRGDYQDPDKYTGNLEYGTILLVDVNNVDYGEYTDPETTGLIKISHGSGINGITVYYKNQNINNIVPQPWSIYYGESPFPTIKNVTLINSYLGIGRSLQERNPHSRLTIENVKGTVLKKGIVEHDSGEVNSTSKVTLSPKYWENANLSAFNDNAQKTSQENIVAKIKAIGGMGIELTDDEMAQFSDIKISGYEYGIYFPSANVIQPRIMASGSMYNIYIDNCSYGIYVDRVDTGIYHTDTPFYAGYNDTSMLDFYSGYVISNSYIEGSKCAIWNHSPEINGYIGTIKLNDVTIKGLTGGAGRILFYSEDSDSYIDVSSVTSSNGLDATGIINNTGKFSNINTDTKTKTYGTNFVVIEGGTAASSINAALKQVGDNGGGVVYLKAGVYELDATLNVPANVELKGIYDSPSYYACLKFENGAVTKPATIINIKNNITAVNLAGNNAGVTGIFFTYQNNIESLEANNGFTQYPYTITSNNQKGVYIKNVIIAGASHGIGLGGCENYTISDCFFGVLDNAIADYNGKNGVIKNCLENETALSRNNMYFLAEGHLFSNVFPYSKTHLSYIFLRDAENVKIKNCFSYGSRIYLNSYGSTVYAVNNGSDGMDENGIMYYSSDDSVSNIVAINSQLFNGAIAQSCITGNSESNVGLYNRFYTANDGAPSGNIYQADQKNTIFKADNWTTKQYNDTKIEPNLELVYDSNSNMINVSNKNGTPYYSVGTKIDESNYTTLGSTSIPTTLGKAEGTYTVYYYIPENNEYYDRDGQVSVTITNTDNVPPTASVSYSTTNLTNENVMVEITSNEALQEVTGWTLSTDKKKLTKTYTANASETVTIKDLVGNTASVEISIENIDKTAPELTVSYNPTTATNGKVTATITSNEALQEVSGWTLSKNKKVLTKEYLNNVSGEKIVVKDLVGNESTATITISNIDSDAPVLNVSYNILELTNRSVVATITSNKQLQALNGWTLSNDKKILTKEYTSNTTEEITVIDLVGNSATITIKIANIDKIAPIGEVSYSTIEPTSGSVIATITSNEVLQEVNGWDLSNDKKVLTKTYTSNTSENVMIKDLGGNSTVVSIVINNIQNEEIKKGDLNKNGKIDIGDILLLQRHIAQSNSTDVANNHPSWRLSEEDIRKADFNGNGKVDIGDILILQRYIAATNSDNVSSKHPTWLEI